MMRRGVAIAWFAVLLGGPAFAQQGSINGVVTDGTGAVLPGVVVKATEANTGFSSESVSGTDGRYNFPALRPTDYTLTAELTGFRTYQQAGVQLAASQALTVNVVMALGDMAETVQVSGLAADVNVTTATISEVVDHKRINELPLNGRNAAALTTLVPGTILTMVDRENSKSVPGAMRLSTNGGEERQVSYMLDGTSNTDPFYRQNQPFPFPDALQEFSIQTSNYSAAQGGSAGAIVNAVTRSGTNTLNGGAFVYVRDRAFNARNFFAPEKDHLRRRQFGGFAGGPIRRNQTFFFVGYQGTTIKNRGTDVVAFAPTIDQRNGNFTTCGSPCNRPIIDPDTGQAFVGNQIPVARFDPAAVNLLEYLPSVGGDGQVRASRTSAQENKQFIIRVDQQLTPKDQVNVRYFTELYDNAPIYDEGNLLTYRSDSNLSSVRTQNFVGAWTRTLTANLLNQFHVGYNRQHAYRAPPPGVPDISELGVKLPLYTSSPSIQSINVDGFFQLGNNPDGRFTRDAFEINNKMSWTKGKHSVQFGFGLSMTEAHIANEYRRAGSFTFDGRYTGNAVADLLLGKLGVFDQGTGEFMDNYATFMSFFVQDDIKITPRLSLNVGLRYEPAPAWKEDAGRFELFTVENYQNGVQSTQFPNAPVGELFRGDPGVPENGINSIYSNVAPRFGFAWDVTGDGKTSIRGGGGMFYESQTPANTNIVGVNSLPWSIRLTVQSPQGPFSDPYRGRNDAHLITPDNIGSATVRFPRPTGLETRDPNNKTPLTYNYNLTFERELMPTLMARIAYVGSRHVHGIRESELNPAAYAPGVSTSTTDARRLFAAGGYGSINYLSYDARSVYNSVQMSVSKRYAKGFTINGNYTLSKVEGNFGLDQAVVPNNLLGERDDLLYGPLDQDHRHRMTASWVWELPGSRLGGLAGQILGGWQWTGVMQYQSGKPFTITSGRDNSFTGIGEDRATGTGASLEPPDGSSRLLWFNPAAFAVNDVGTFGTVGKGALYGPWLRTWDMGLFKTVGFGGGKHVQFRAEFFNIFNQANFGLPGTNVSGGGFGRINSTDPNMPDPRIIQFGLKFGF